MLKRTLLLIVAVFVAALGPIGAVHAEDNQPNPADLAQPCEVDFSSVELTAQKGQYVGAEYTFDEHCQPILVAVFHGIGTPPTTDQRPEQER